MAKTSKQNPGRRLSGYCNICNEYGELTRDHVPPKGSIRLTAVEVRNFAQRLSELAPGRVNIIDDDGLQESVRRYKLSQDGVRFRSICARCNNVLLGGRYDLELNRVSQTVGSLIRMHLRGLLALPSEIQINTRTHYLVRAIIGHLLAA
jgi:hypothetical protein